MIRDMELIKRILERAEAIPAGPSHLINETAFDECQKSDEEKQKLIAHVYLLKKEGFIEGDIRLDYVNNRDSYVSAEIRAITWKGYDLIDLLRKP